MTAEDQVRTVLAEHARLPVPLDDVGLYDDLFQRGMTSHASVNVMLALEEAFDVEFPDALLRKSTFESIAAIQSAIDSLTQVGTV